MVSIEYLVKMNTSYIEKLIGKRPLPVKIRKPYWGLEEYFEVEFFIRDHRGNLKTLMGHHSHKDEVKHFGAFSRDWELYKGD